MQIVQNITNLSQVLFKTLNTADVNLEKGPIQQ